MNNEYLFSCDICGYAVRFALGEDRWSHNLQIPDDMLVATCDHCGEFYFTTDEVIKLEKYNS